MNVIICHECGYESVFVTRPNAAYCAKCWAKLTTKPIVKTKKQ